MNAERTHRNKCDRISNLETYMVKRRKGDLPGRYVPPHIRKWPNRPYEYLNVTAYQEHVEPIPAETDVLALQMEFPFSPTE